MKKEILELIRINRNNLGRHISERDNLRNKIRFCSQHQFEEEQRIANIKLNACESIIYEFQEMIDKLSEIVKAEQ